MSAVRDGDFRSEAKDRRRVKNHNVKWSKGAMPAPGKVCHHSPTGRMDATDTCEDCAHRPWPHQRPLFGVDPYIANERVRAHTAARKGAQSEAAAALEEYSDNSASEDAYDGPEEDEFMYSFDARTGPGAGSQILNQAIVQAVERFENKETEKIVREYDLVADGKDELDFVHAEDDFELVDPSHL